MATSNKRRIRKPIELLAQVILYKLAVKIVYSLVNRSFSTKVFFACFLPNNYFVVFYCVIFLLSPYVNKLLESLPYKKAVRMIVALFLIFSVYPAAVHILSNINGEQITGLDSVGRYGSQGGYNIVNFMMAYTIGAFFRIYNIKELFPAKKHLTAAFFACAILITLYSIFEESTIGPSEELGKTAWTYFNPLVFAEAALILLLFLNIDIRNIQWINMASTGVFSVFLLHGSFIRRIGIEYFVRRNAVLMCAHILVSALAVFLICTGIHYIYKALTTPIFDRLFSNNYLIVNLENE